MVTDLSVFITAARPSGKSAAAETNVHVRLFGWVDKIIDVDLLTLFQPEFLWKILKLLH